MRVTFPVASRVAKVAVLLVATALGMVLIYYTIRQKLSPWAVAILTIAYLALARTLVGRLVIRSGVQQSGDIAVRTRNRASNGIKAFGCFLGAGALAWFGPQVLPDTTLGATILGVPLVILLFGGAIFVARSFSKPSE